MADVFCVDSGSYRYGVMFVARLFVGIRQEWDIRISVQADPLLERNLLCNEAFLYVRYSFQLSSNKFSDLSLLQWPCSGWYRDAGGQCGKKKHLLHRALEAGTHVHKTTYVSL